MNSFAMIITLILGTAAVLQAGMNRQILEYWGILPAVLLNSMVFLFISGGLYLTSFLYPSLFPASFKLSTAFTQFKGWYLLPGLFGFCLVMGLPIVISQIGATKTFVYLVIAQMLCSLVWDMVQESIPMTWTRALAVMLAIASVTMISWKK